jgi:hypothetical protein
MTQSTRDPIRALPKAPQPPLSYPGATPDSDRAKKPPLAEPSVTDQELNPGDRVEGLGNFEADGLVLLEPAPRTVRGARDLLALRAVARRRVREAARRP